jgi:hypothetical protein
MTLLGNDREPFIISMAKSAAGMRRADRSLRGVADRHELRARASGEKPARVEAIAARGVASAAHAGDFSLDFKFE